MEILKFLLLQTKQIDVNNHIAEGVDGLLPEGSTDTTHFGVHAKTYLKGTITTYKLNLQRNVPRKR